jgi:hypothetical protein
MSEVNGTAAAAELPAPNVEAPPAEEKKDEQAPPEPEKSIIKLLTDALNSTGPITAETQDTDLIHNHLMIQFMQKIWPLFEEKALEQQSEDVPAPLVHEMLPARAWSVVNGQFALPISINSYELVKLATKVPELFHPWLKRLDAALVELSADMKLSDCYECLCIFDKANLGVFGFRFAQRANEKLEQMTKSKQSEWLGIAQDRSEAGKPLRLIAEQLRMDQESLSEPQK